MAFTTVTGASGAPTTYTGTDGVDLLTLVNPGSSVVDALGADDTVNFNLVTATTTASDITVRGGQGADSIQNVGSVTAANFLVSSYIAGNLGDDNLFTAGTGFIGNASTVQGGQGSDTIDVAFTNGGSLINGNLGNDTINAGTGAATNPGGVASFTATSLFGGQGNDTINVGGAATVTLSGVSIDGAIGNDTITVAALTTASSATVAGGAGNDTINTAAATQALIIRGDDGIDVITATTGANDTIDGGAGGDVITGGTGADSQTGGLGADSFNVNAGQNGTAATAISVAAGNPDRLVSATGGFDIITDFSITEGDKLSNGAAGTAVTDVTAADITGAGNYMARGNFVATNGTTGTFTVSATGNDILYATTGAALTTAASLGTTNSVLLGVGAQIGTIVAGSNFVA